MILFICISLFQGHVFISVCASIYPALLFMLNNSELKKIKNKEKNQQIETGLKQLYRKSVNIVDIGIDCVAVNGKAKMRLDTEAAAAEKTSDSAEYMKQRNQYRVNIKKLR